MLQGCGRIVVGRRVLPGAQNVEDAEVAVGVCNRLRMWAVEGGEICGYTQGVRTVTGLMKKFDDREVQIAGMLALAACVERANMEGVVREMGGREAVWRALKMWDGDMEVVKVALITLRSLGWEGGGIVEILKRWENCESVTRNGLAVLRNEEDAVEVVLRGMRRYNCWRLWSNGCGALRRILESGEQGEKFVTQDGIQAVLKVARLREHEGARMEALSVLECLGRQRLRVRLEDASEEVVRCVEEALKEDDIGDMFVEMGFRVLRRWTAYDKGGEGMVTAAVEYAKRYLSLSSGGEILREVCMWLRWRLRSEIARREFRGLEDGVEVLVKCIQAVEYGKEHVLLALGNAVFEGEEGRVARCGGFRIVIGVLNGSAAVVEAGLTCLQGICASADNAEEAVKVGCHRVIVRVLSKHEDNLPIVERGLSVILSISGSAEGIAALRESGALDVARKAVKRFALSRTLNAQLCKIEQLLRPKARRMSSLLRHLSNTT